MVYEKISVEKNSQVMRILLLGATGRTGKHILKGCLLKGYPMNILVRNSKDIPVDNPLLKVIKGTPESKDDIANALKNCDMVISALNISRTSDFPWSGLRTPKTLLSDSMKYVLQAAKPGQLKRIIVVSAWGVHESFRELPGWFRWFIQNSNIGPAYQDHERQETLLKNQPVNWTAVRPVGLTNSAKEKPVTVSINGKPRPSLLISRKNVAQFVVNEIEHKKHINMTITVSQERF